MATYPSEVLPDNPTDHPSARAWRRMEPDGFELQNIEILKKLKRKSGVYRLTGAGNGSVVIAKILEKESSAYGYDAQAGEYGDLVSKGIIDPAKVVRSALQGAASVAGLLITTEAMVAEVPGPPPPELPGHDHDEHPGDMDF